MSKYDTVIGLEIHIQAKTKTKMFSRVSADYFGKAPNTCVDPVVLGLPGALPVPNKKALEHCIRLSLALGCKISEETKFDRKNYFYPDLPKAYQISQYDQPIGYKGEMAVESEKLGRRNIRITRVHMEEDTGKSIHEGDKTLLDFNKAGVPLIEVVTEPDFMDNEEIDYFAKRLRQIVRYLGVSDADMEKGQMRYELNISLRKKSETGLPNYKVEVKNIGSISLLQKVIEFEVARQTEILDKGETPVQETRGTRDMTGKTHSQRVKEEADDYRYFPEPDIPPLYFSEKYVKELQNSLPKLPEQLLTEYTQFGLSKGHAETIIASKEYVDAFEKFIDYANKNKQEKLLAEVSKIVVEEQAFAVAPELIFSLVELKQADKINSSTQKTLLKPIVDGELKTKLDIEKYLEENNLIIKSDNGEVEKIAREEIAKDPTARERYAKNPNMAMFFVGQVMRQTGGSANPKLVKDVVEKILQEK